MPRLVELDTLLEALDIEDRDNKGSRLSSILEATETLVERRARRRFSPLFVDANGDETDGTMTFTTRGADYIRLPDLRVVTSVFHHGFALGPSDYDLGPQTPPYAGADIPPTTGMEFLWSNRQPQSRYFGQVSRIGGIETNDLVITGKWGFSSCPEDVVEAILRISARAWKRRESQWADTVVTGSKMLVFSKDLAPEDEAVILSYRPKRVAVVGGRSL